MGHIRQHRVFEEGVERGLNLHHRCMERTPLVVGAEILAEQADVFGPRLLERHHHLDQANGIWSPAEAESAGPAPLARHQSGGGEPPQDLGEKLRRETEDIGDFTALHRCLLAADGEQGQGADRIFGTSTEHARILRPRCPLCQRARILGYHAGEECVFLR